MMEIPNQSKMAHEAQRHFVELAARNLPSFFKDCTVLEVGSLNLGKSVRDFFENCNYTGLDVGEGDGVDVVCGGQDFNAPDGSFKHVITCNAMEHNPYWKETFANMIRLCQQGGLITMTCATIGCKEHGTISSCPTSSPLSIGIGWDYYRNLTSSDFTNSFNLDRYFSAYKFWHNWYTFDLYFLGLRNGKPDSSQVLDGWSQAVKVIGDSVEESNAPVPIKLRRIGAMLGGDEIFNKARRLHEKLNYLLNVTG